ncbi:MAG: hypothetical protein HC930_04325 [Hydrococcus sp. SU_1_0]|nr:hypothetical protein [Hydrococcus sp. SU_1_0]
MTQYLIDIPNQDPSLPWMIIKTFNHQDLATAFAQRTWQATNGLFCLIAYEQQYFNVRVPNPNFFSSTQPFLFVEGFQHYCDALDFAISNYGASETGYINLLKTLSFPPSF